jgi:hypothetical protein
MAPSWVFSQIFNMQLDKESFSLKREAQAEQENRELLTW